MQFQPIFSRFHACCNNINTQAFLIQILSTANYICDSKVQPKPELAGDVKSRVIRLPRLCCWWTQSLTFTDGHLSAAGKVLSCWSINAPKLKSVCMLLGFQSSDRINKRLPDILSVSVPQARSAELPLDPSAVLASATRLGVHSLLTALVAGGTLDKFVYSSS